MLKNDRRNCFHDQYLRKFHVCSRAKGSNSPLLDLQSDALPTALSGPDLFELYDMHFARLRNDLMISQIACNIFNSI